MKNTTKILLVSLLFFIAACSSGPNANTIIKKSIKKAGGKKFDHSRISFTFRGTRFHVKRQGDTFNYQRVFDDSTGTEIKDQLTNDGFTRMKAGQMVELSSSDSAAYANGLNSVVYFGLLPYKLNDAAVNKKLLDKTSISGKPYYEIKVTFDKKGGGKDHGDTFIYWINRDNYAMDYMAYRFHVNEGGTRFREAHNVRTIKGMRFQDYHNLGGPDMKRPLEDYDSYFEADTLAKVSEINLEDIKVQIFD